MKEKIKENYFFIALLILLGIGGGIYYWQYQKYQERMVKMDACIQGCPPGLGRYLLGSQDSRCKEGCREKYGVTWKDFYKWEEKK